MLPGRRRPLSEIAGDAISMAQVLNLNPLLSSTRPESNGLRFCPTTRNQVGIQSWSSLQQQLKCHGKFSCLFSGSGREERARKALDNSLGGKKDEFEKWNKELKKREEAGGGGDSGGGGWFGWGGRFGWSNGDNFWPEAQQTIIAVLGIIAFYLIVAKGEVLLAVIFNPLLYAFIPSQILRRASPDSPADVASTSKNEIYAHVSAKERVLRKWGSN